MNIKAKHLLNGLAGIRHKRVMIGVGPLATFISPQERKEV